MRALVMISKVARMAWRGAKWFGGFLIATTLMLAIIILIFPNAVLRWTVETWSVAGPPESADAIFVLGGGNAFRPQAAARLWEEGYARTIVVFRAEDPDSEARSELIVKETVDILTEEGVSESDIVVLGSSVSSTYDEAVATARMVEEKGYSKILIPTHIFHSRRVRRIFSKLVDCEIVVTEADYVHFRSDRWWKNEWGMIQFPNEVLKDIFYRIRY